jgi:hypothetical protein
LVENSYLVVKMSLNSETEWQAITDPTKEAPRFGTLDMYDVKAGNKQQETKEINIPNEYKGLTFAFEFGNAVKGQSFEISMWGSDNWATSNPNIAKK